jgi:hypothetical protein
MNTMFRVANEPIEDDGNNAMERPADFETFELAKAEYEARRKIGSIPQIFQFEGDELHHLNPQTGERY